MNEKPNNNPKQVEQTDWRSLREQHYQQAAEGITPTYSFSYYVKVREAVIGICFGGLIYVIIRLLFIITSSLLGESDPTAMFCGTLGFAFLSMAGIVAFAAMSLVCLAFTFLVVRSIQAQPCWQVLAVMAGGLTGFMGGWAMIDPIYMALPEDLVIQLLLGPVPATILCQLGAAWTTQPLESIRKEESQDQPVETSATRLNLIQVLIASAWVATLLTVVKLTDALGEWSLSIASAWLVFQATTLWLSIWLVGKVRGK